MSSIKVNAWFHAPTSTLSYVVWDERTSDCVIIDPVLDFDPITQLITDKSAKRIFNFIKIKDLKVHWILETHVHADHLSAGRQMKNWFASASWGASEKLELVFQTFKKLFSWNEKRSLNDLGLSRYFRDEEEFCAGSLRFKVMETPGHTPACLTYQVKDWLFTGDALFMPDSGVGRCDFPGGKADSLYSSIWGKLYALPDQFEYFTGHDYQPSGRPLEYRASLRESKRHNTILRLNTSRQDFISLREARDKTLVAPGLLRPSLEWNLCGVLNP